MASQATPNAATDTCESLVLGLLVGVHGAAPADLSVAFVSRAAAASGSFGRPHDLTSTRRRRVAVLRAGARGLSEPSVLPVTLPVT